MEKYGNILSSNWKEGLAHIHSEFTSTSGVSNTQYLLLSWEVEADLKGQLTLKLIHEQNLACPERNEKAGGGGDVSFVLNYVRHIII